MEKSILVREAGHEPHKILFGHNVFIHWDDKYNLGIPIIDEQHRGIVTTINSLYFGIQNHFISHSFASIVQMMYDYTRIHFEVEEAFFKAMNFIHAEEHCVLHGELMEELTIRGKESLLKGNPNQFMDFLKGWWIHHICREDLRYRDYLA